MAITFDTVDKGRYKLFLDGLSLIMTGCIDTVDSGDYLENVMKELHEKILQEGAKEFKIDLKGLKFINSPAISVFAEWITIIEEEPDDKKYVLVFVCNIKEHMWQEATISSLEFINPDLVRKEVIL